MAGKADPWADVDFDEIMDATCLEMDDIKVLFNCFQLFDTKKQDYLLADDIDEVMRYKCIFKPSKQIQTLIVSELWDFAQQLKNLRNLLRRLMRMAPELSSFPSLPSYVLNSLLKIRILKLCELSWSRHFVYLTSRER